ncbi:MAG TPA: TonB-dependent hemoglobin/transferrin/lactoferrin family receptor [Allosphingosinicella sp.]|nr:TonB-dependent hemoglobin/transferrin/lactoferrin family receptor [Allosphingosinicella sp.]
MTRATLLLGTALVAMPGTAWAQTQPAEEAPVQLASAETPGQQITVTATRTPTPTGEVPATVTVIDEQRIADELATDSRDLVRFEPGVSVPRGPTRFGAALGVTGRDGNSGFRIRGIGGNRVLIQVDGIRVPDGFTFGAQAAGRGDYVDLGIVKSVEILRGPASALYGSDGLAGAVSFTTSDPGDLMRGDNDIAALGRVTYDSASDEFSETALVAGRSGNISGLISYTRRDGHELENQGTNDALNATRTRANPLDTRSNAVLGKLVLDAGGGHRFRLTGEYGDSRVETDVISGRTTPPAAPNPLPATAVIDLYARDTIDRARVSLDWRYTGEGAIDFAQVAIYWQQANNRQFTFEDRNTAADRTRINTFDNEVYGASAEARSSFQTGGLRHQLVYGGDISVTRQEGLRDGTVPPAGETFPTRAFPATDFTRAGLFVGDEITLAGGHVTLHPALRFDHYSLNATNDPLLPAFQGADQSSSRVTPRFGAVVRIGDSGFSVYGNYAQGFKAPEPSQVNQFFSNLGFGYTSIPNPDLGPERSETWEAGLRYQGPIASASLTAFTGRYRDFISQEVVAGSFTPADPAIYQFINLDRVKIHGIEGRASLNFPSGFNADVAFAYASGDVVDPLTGTESPLSSIDPLKVVLGAGWRDPGGRFGAQLYLTATARKDLDDTVGICAAACFRPEAATILDATAFWRISENFTLRAGIFNITDETYAYWGDVAGLAATSTVIDAYTQPGRNGRVSLSVRF